MKAFEIFRSGKHTPNQGTALTFSDADLSAIAAGYDKNLHHAPIVVGHPGQDHPAYGWIDGLAVKGDRLVAKPADIDASFSELVKEGKFRKVSAAFYRPDSPNNPRPGAYYLRHVGFLGAAAPAVKGLKPVEFAEDDLVVEFDDAFADWRGVWAIDAAARLFRGVRDWMIESKDLETADRVLPQWEIDQLVSSAAEMRAEKSAELAYSEAQPKDQDMTDKTAALDAREAQLAQREKNLADQEKARRTSEDAAFVDGVVKAGRLPIGLQATATALFAEMGDEELTFADGADQVKTSPRGALRSLLEKLPVPVATGELATGDGPDFSDRLVVAAAITTEIRDAAGKGETISPIEAARRLKLGSQA
jgi:hypothetical protein